MRAAHAEHVHVFSASFLSFKEAGQTTERRVSKMVGFVMDAIVIISAEQCMAQMLHRQCLFFWTPSDLEKF